MSLHENTKHFLKITSICAACVGTFAFFYEEGLDYEVWFNRGLPVLLVYILVTRLTYGAIITRNSILILLPLAIWYIKVGTLLDEYTAMKFSSYQTYSARKTKLLEYISYTTAYLIGYFALVCYYGRSYLILWSFNVHAKLKSIFSHKGIEFESDNQKILTFLFTDYINRWMDQNPELVDRWGDIMSRERYQKFKENSTKNENTNSTNG